MKKILLAFQFLTIVPLSNSVEAEEREVGGATAFFPLVGAIEGIIYIVTAWLCLKVFPSDLTSGFLVFVMVVVNGGLHIDGLSDTADAVACRGDREKKLAVMKDGTVGPAGVVSIVMVLLLKFLLLNTAAFYSRLESYYSALFLLPVLARWTMIPAIFHCRAVRDAGLGRLFIDHTGVKEVAVSTVIVVLLSIFTLMFNRDFRIIAFIFMFMMPILYVFSRMAVSFFQGHFGGMTGDSFGSVYEISIIVFLISWVIWSQKFIS